MPKYERIGYIELLYKEIKFGQDDQALMESFKKGGKLKIGSRVHGKG